MPSLFKKHKDSPSEPPNGDDKALPQIAVVGAVELVGSIAEDEDARIARSQLEASQALGNAIAGSKKYVGSTMRQVLNNSGMSGTLIQTDFTSAQTIVAPLNSAIGDSEAMKVVRAGLNTLADKLPALLKNLDAVAQIHPFIGVAVGAFKVVVNLDLKRRDNDKKVDVLFSEMKDMMEVLLQLGEIKGPTLIAPDGKTIEARLQGLVIKTADDIKACANTCDVYSKKKLIVKVIKSSSWDGALKAYVDKFSARRKEFTFELAMHTGAGIDDANRRLRDLDAKLDIVLEFFTRAVSPEQRELADLVKQRGGPAAVVRNNSALKELVHFKPSVASAAGKRDREVLEEHSSHVTGDENADLEALREECEKSLEEDIVDNLKQFERKFLMQQRALVEEMRGMVHHETDRAIDAMTDVINAGSHDRIIDSDIHTIWKDMRWPGHVKARQFVLALKDYYAQQSEKNEHGKLEEEKKARIVNEDHWAFEWITVNRLQAISEAFDDDASGYITIAEINHFTSSRPEGWRYVHFFPTKSIDAQFECRWQTTTCYYRGKIVDLCAKMFDIRPFVLEANRKFLDDYLHTVWKQVSTLTSAVVVTDQPDSLKQRFQSYVDSEEHRLREGLEICRYDIDAMDTLTLITGPGRIERFVMPLLYLLLSKDWEIFQLCRTTVIHKDELFDAADTMARYNNLLAIFKQQQMDLAQAFKSWAGELFDYWHDGSKFWSIEGLREREFREIQYDNTQPLPELDVAKLLNYPLAADSLYGPLPEDAPTEHDAAADDHVSPILGRWNMLAGSEERWPVTSMTTFCFHASVDSNSYSGKDIGAQGSSFTVSGSYKTTDDGTIEYSFTRTYTARITATFFVGTLSDDGQTLSGAGRVAPEILAARPPPSAFTGDRIKALWTYALTYGRDEARRRLFSWSYIKERRDRREQYVMLSHREDDDALTKDDLDTFELLDRRSTCAEARAFYVLRDYRQRANYRNIDVVCDACGENMYGARMVCITCGTDATIDLCGDKPTCVGKRIEVAARDDLKGPHLPAHDLVKIRANIHYYREIGRVLRAAKAGMARADELLDAAAAKKSAAEKQPTTPKEGAFDIHERKQQAESVSGEPEGMDDEKNAEEPACRAPLNCRLPPPPPGLRRSNTSTPWTWGKTLPQWRAARRTRVRIVRGFVARPCWYCTDCPSEHASHRIYLLARRSDPRDLPADAAPFLCMECDEREKGVAVQTHIAPRNLEGRHRPSHNLVRCIDRALVAADEKVEEERETKARLGALETQVAGLTAKIEQLLLAIAADRGGRVVDAVPS
ncbi:uncharacterized protein BXZ73DRAFT_88023 [Epithele typhae]|uniref:uncharacterized protein n=1 Tax=Epithele typhae TaxID=378194 RepID=UPI0020073B87|nr:uncharacterized protein BXZ73DRAFT_88023 [Epithele typhae]KAH9942449.1 hypothetical protein BXZ73DRAFT_88023 [Epithele typhae]